MSSNDSLGGPITVDPTGSAKRKPGRPKGSRNKERADVYKRPITTKLDDEILFTLKYVAKKTGIPFNHILEDMSLQFLEACQLFYLLPDRKQKYRGCSEKIIRKYKQIWENLD